MRNSELETAKAQPHATWIPTFGWQIELTKINQQNFLRNSFIYANLNIPL